MAKTYSEIYNIKDPKEKLFAAMDSIESLKFIKNHGGLTDKEQNELDNLEVLQMNAYSDWKDPK